MWEYHYLQDASVLGKNSDLLRGRNRDTSSSNYHPFYLGKKAVIFNWSLF